MEFSRAAGSGVSSVVGSAGSAPAITPSRTAASATHLVIGPAVSCADEIGTMPFLLTRPRVGLSPTTPQLFDGLTIEPSVSVPIASGASPAAIATPEPELEPDGLRPVPYGFTACLPSLCRPLVEFLVRKLADSDKLAMPNMTAPASRSLPTRNASVASA